MMILLVDLCEIGKISEPMAIAALHSYLTANGIEASMYYTKFDKYTLTDELRRTNPSVVGISVTVERNPKNIKNAIMEIKQYNPDIKIIIGGHLPTIDPYSFFYDNVDAVFVGPGEISLYKYIKALEEGTLRPAINGILYSPDDPVTEPEFVKDLDVLPFMSRKYLPCIREKLNAEPIVQILSSRGCFGNCSFCTVRYYMNIANIPYLERSVANVADEIEYLYKNYDVRRIIFEDDNFFSRKNIRSKTQAFYKELKDRNIVDLNISLQIRADLVDIESIMLLKQIGVKSLSMGIESFNDNELKYYNKGIKSDAIHKSIRILKDLGYSFDLNSEYRIFAGYITFSPYSTTDNLLNSSKWLRHYGITPKKLLRKVIPYKGTPLWDNLNKDDMLNDDGSIRFKEDGIAEKYEVFKEIFYNLIAKRDQYRFPLKFTRDHGKMIDAGFGILKLKDAVKYYDNMIFDAFDEVIQTEGNYKAIIDDYNRKSQAFDKKDAIYSSVLELLNEYNVQYSSVSSKGSQIINYDIESAY